MSSPTGFLGQSADIAYAVADVAVAWGCALAKERDALAESFIIRWRELVLGNAALCVDEGARRAVELAAMVAAAADELTLRVADTATVMKLLREALVEPRRAHVGDWLEERMGVSQDGSGAAFKQIAANFKSGGERTFGSGFIYEQEKQTGDQSFVNVRKCIFNDFFHLNNRPHLTKLFCALDAIWAEELNAGNYDVSFERPSMMGENADMCRFQFTRREISK